MWTGGYVSAASDIIGFIIVAPITTRQVFLPTDRPTAAASLAASRLLLMEAISRLSWLSSRCRHVRLHLGPCPAPRRWQLQLQHLYHRANVVAIFNALFNCLNIIIGTAHVVCEPGSMYGVFLLGCYRFAHSRWFCLSDSVCRSMGRCGSGLSIDCCTASAQ